MRRLSIVLAALLALACFPALAQNSWTTPGGSTADGGVGMCLNAAGLAVPVGPSCAGATPSITASATGTTGATAATLAASSTLHTWICGFVITSGGTTSAAVGNATVTGTIGGTLNFTYVDVSIGQGIVGVAFPQCLPSSAINTAIVVTAPAGGAGTTVAVSAWGFQQ